MRVWETFKQGTRLFRDHFGQLLLLNAITYLPAAIAAFMVARESMPIGLTDEALQRWAVVVGILVLALTVWSLVSMMTLHYAVADAYETGSCDWRVSLRRCVPRLPVFIGVMLATGAVFAAAAGIVYALVSTGIVALAVAGILAVVVLVIVAVAVVSFAVPVLVREELGVTAVLRRAWELTRPNFLKILGLLLVSGLIVGAIQRVVGGVIEQSLGANAEDPGRLLLAAFVAMCVPALVFTPWTVAVVTIAYINVRRDRGELGDDGPAPSPTGPAPRDPAGAALTVASGDGTTSAGGAPARAAAMAVAERRQDAQAALDPDAEIRALLDLDQDERAARGGGDRRTDTSDVGDPGDDIRALIDLDGGEQAAPGRPRWSEPLGTQEPSAGSA